MTATFAFVDIFKSKEKPISLEPLTNLLPVVATVMAVTVTVLGAWVATRIKTSRDEKKREADDDDDPKKEKQGTYQAR